MADEHALTEALDELQHSLRSLNAIEQLLLDASPARELDGVRRSDLAALIGIVNGVLGARFAAVVQARSHPPQR